MRLTIVTKWAKKENRCWIVQWKLWRQITSDGDEFILKQTKRIHVFGVETVAKLIYYHMLYVEDNTTISIFSNIIVLFYSKRYDAVRRGEVNASKVVRVYWTKTASNLGAGQSL